MNDFSSKYNCINKYLDGANCLFFGICNLLDQRGESVICDVKGMKNKLKLIESILSNEQKKAVASIISTSSKRKKGRQLFCKICGEKWNPRKGAIFKFYDRHIELHGLNPPERNEEEDVDEYLKRLRVFREKYFEDL